jgi:hypothetical protein
MEAADASETLSTLHTSIPCKDTRIESVLTLNHLENIESVILVIKVLDKNMC